MKLYQYFFPTFEKTNLDNIFISRRNTTWRKIINENELDNKQSYLIIKKLIENSDQQISMIKNLQKIKNFDTNSLIYKQMNLI